MSIDDQALTEMLMAARPLPSPALVERLRYLRALRTARPKHLRAKIAGSAGLGAALLLLAAAITFL